MLMRRSAGVGLLALGAILFLNLGPALSAGPTAVPEVADSAVPEVADGARPQAAGTAVPDAGDGARPNAADAARTAAEELATLPAGMVQVDCAPGMPTFPIFTQLSGVPSPNRIRILADGRCFAYLHPVPEPEPEAIDIP